MAKFMLSVFLMFLASACASSSLDQNFAFNTTKSDGILAIKNPRINNESWLFLQKVDLTEQKFVGSPLEFSTCDDCLPSSNTYKLEKSDTPDFRLLPIPPGTYAIVGLLKWERTGGNQRKSLHSCFAKATAVFEVKAGKVNMVATAKNQNSAISNLTQLKSLVSTFPGITSDVISAQLLAVIAFDANGHGPLQSNCLNGIDGRSFNILRRLDNRTIASIATTI
ncbi:hypothetical protein NBZ79_06520 [Sneathiella marina]|uniref:DUF5675 domain-containing protein n=1 Tax=Sneathiella marina TaxID=2950108 RepID=A0ABY4WBL1_9PROT|nr:hypothetical protein [Sneathiella marina]USG62629.1 hypothetical protein NBZ79_06520 [Sneathiella marina]